MAIGAFEPSILFTYKDQADFAGSLEKSLKNEFMSMRTSTTDQHRPQATTKTIAAAAGASMLSKPLGAGIMALGELDVVSKNQRGQKYLGHGVRDQFLSTQLATALTREPRIQSEIRDAGRKDEAAISSPKSMRSSAMGKVSRGVEFASGSATQSFVKKLGTDMGKKIADLMRKTALPK